MSQSVVEAHPRLHHYTTAAGLQGIVESQQIWATSIAYLNDAEEHTGFYDRRLARLMEPALREGLTTRAQTDAGRRQIERNGGIDVAIKIGLDEFIPMFRSATLAFNNPFIASFCRVTDQVANDGLLSQWRGYGTDGGYAIEFDTAALEQLLRLEQAKYYYQYSVWGDVEYYNQNSSEAPVHAETQEWETGLKNAVRDYVLDPRPDRLGEMLEPLTALSCLHKHRGFSEEAEVRIVALPTNDDIFQEALADGEKRPRRLIKFRATNGVLVPYISLFGNGEKLPIRRILVGPHPDKIKRQWAVRQMLAQHGVEAEVTSSDIPYLGR